MTGKRRAWAQDAFGTGAVNIVVATDAFGLGVDYPDVRAVVLYDPANDISAFVQQAGRAGRDRKISKIYICSGDAQDGWRSRRFLVESAFPPVSTCEMIWSSLVSSNDALSIPLVATGTKLSTEVVCASLYWLSRKNLVRHEPDPLDKRRKLYSALGKFIDADWVDYELEHADSLAALDELRALWRLPANQIPTAINAAFSDSLYRLPGRTPEESHREVAKNK